MLLLLAALGALVVGVLLLRLSHVNRSYHPTGPKLLSRRDIARIIAGYVGHRVRAVDLPLWMFLKAARMQTVDPYEIALFVRYIEDNKQGTFSYGGGLTQVVEQLTGKPAESFDVTARRYAELPFAAQTVSNRLKALLRFAIAPFYPGYNLEAFERRVQIPPASKPLYCMEDPRWKESHAAQVDQQAGPVALIRDQTEGNNLGQHFLTSVATKV